MSCQNILELNDDCLLEIAHQLMAAHTDKNDWLTYASVCRRFMYIFCTSHKREIASLDVKRCMDVLEWNTFKAMADCLNESLQSVRLVYDFSDLGGMLLQRMQIGINIEDDDDDDHDQKLKYLSQVCLNVESLIICEQALARNVFDMIQSWKKIKQLRIIGGSGNLNAYLKMQAFIDFLNNQQNIDLFNAGQFYLTSTDLLLIAKLNITRLKTCFRLRTPIDFEFLPKLTHLHVQGDFKSIMELTRRKSNQLIGLRCDFVSSIYKMPNLHRLGFRVNDFRSGLCVYNTRTCIPAGLLFRIIEKCVNLRTLGVHSVNDLQLLDQLIGASEHPNQLNLFCVKGFEPSATYKWIQVHVLVNEKFEKIHFFNDSN